MPGSDGSLEHLLQCTPREKLERLLESRGVLSEFIDYSGSIVSAPLEDRLSVLAVMGSLPADEQAVDRQLAEAYQGPWRRWIAPVLSVTAEQPMSLRFNSRDSEDAAIQWRIRLENNEAIDGGFNPVEFTVSERCEIDADSFVARDIPLPALPAGYHHLSVGNGSRREQALVIAAPERCHEPAWLREGERLWGISAQLYSLVSMQNGGIGDFADLQELIERVAAAGADFVLLNPLHAPDPAFPDQASPYSPTDRRFLNPLYIAPALEEDFTDSPEVQALMANPDFSQTLEELGAGALVDYKGVFHSKLKIFTLMYRHFQEHSLDTGSPRDLAFQDFLSRHGEALQAFARCQAAVPVTGVAAWSDPVFHLYLQWLADRQLDKAGQLARTVGMRVGLIRDLAVGSSTEGCEVKSSPGLFCLQARVGAPPDDFNPLGQNWGLPPLRPDVLVSTGFEHFIILLRENMRSCGALRIDHVMALMRLWWHPLTGTQKSGAYVRYPVDLLFAILRLESRRAQCLIIGEDLGVVPPEIRPYLDGSGLLSNRVFYFEKYDGGYFRKPEHYPQRALAFVANHDVPPLKGWWQHEDLTLRRRLGLIVSDEALADSHRARDQEQHLLLQWLDDQGLLPAAWRDRNIARPFDAALCSAVLRAFGTCNAQMVSVQLDDLAGLDSPVNVPGTDNEYPNWRRKMPATLETLFSSEDCRQMLRGIQETRGNR